MSEKDEFMHYVPGWYKCFFEFLPLRELESIHLQIEFDRSQRDTSLPPLQELAETCLKLYQNQKVRSNYFAYLTGKLASSAGKNRELRELVEQFSNVAELLLWRGMLYVGEGFYDKAKEIYEQCEKTISSENPYPYLDLKLAKANIVVATNEYEKGLEENDELMDLINFIQRQHQGLDTSFFEYNGRSERIQIFLHLGRLPEAQELMEQLLFEVDEGKVAHLEARSYIYVISGLLKQSLGQIPTAKELFIKAKKLYTQIGEAASLVFVDGVLGYFKIIEGNREEGEKILKDVIARSQELDSLWDVIQFTMSLAYSYLAADEKVKAYELIRDLDEYLDRVTDVTQGTAIEVAQIAINNEDTKLAHKYIEKLRVSLEQNPSVSNEISLCVLKSALESTRANMHTGILHTEKALELAEKNEIFPKVLSTKIRLASLNLTKWMYVENNELLEISQKNLYDALMLIPSDNANRIEIEYVSVLLDLLIDFDFSATIRKFDTIEQTIETMGLGKDINEKFQKNRLKTFKFKDLLDKEELYEDDVKILLYNTIRRILLGLSSLQVDKLKEADIKMILVLNEAGLPLYVKNFGTASENEDLLLSAFLSALNSFSAMLSDVPEGHLQTIKHENYTIMVETYLSFMIAMICSEETYEARRKLHTLITQLSKDEFVNYKDLSSKIQRLPEFEESVNSKVEGIFIPRAEES
ncbi:MAG: tetratricopeptide repeat protein, partial [Candidatus Hodarchaeota archaeon]